MKLTLGKPMIFKISNTFNRENTWFWGQSKLQGDILSGNNAQFAWDRSDLKKYSCLIDYLKKQYQKDKFPRKKIPCGGSAGKGTRNPLSLCRTRRAPGWRGGGRAPGPGRKKKKVDPMFLKLRTIHWLFIVCLFSKNQFWKRTRKRDFGGFDLRWNNIQSICLSACDCSPSDNFGDTKETKDRQWDSS